MEQTIRNTGVAIRTVRTCAGAPLSVLFRYAFHTAFTRTDCAGTYPMRRVQWDDVDSEVNADSGLNMDVDSFFMELVFSDVDHESSPSPGGCPAAKSWCVT